MVSDLIYTLILLDISLQIGNNKMLASKQNSTEPSVDTDTSASAGSRSKESYAKTGLLIEPGWKIGEKILCRYMNQINKGIFYEAKIESIGSHEGQPVYEIHYPVF
jgi:hypothetical protein